MMLQDISDRAPPTVVVLQFNGQIRNIIYYCGDFGEQLKSVGVFNVLSK